ncbi:DMT family transporter [Anaerocolumna xylanovorans]|uniref:Permease of the drug/metabolite transporter (DMT) superfamily n=1 Tax=Anaerocolumna xylanovorans DSM 12503 TaxID=1121345 RepID=A0A1M7XX30_9FIRM|nr:DMT family transporter [Anaerocolumna xylanovorans]SHO43413.1 Permease of the drug/metabolite transporter (DMT) superfamily [Anaerocolumna xylanovorans DSM 12503]
MKNSSHPSYLYAILAAFLFSLNSPFSKLLLEKIPPALMAALLYLGAGFGMTFLYLLQRTSHHKKEARLTKQELPFILGMIFLDIAAPILLMSGLTKTSAANASLLGNFEIAATALIAFFVFKEAIGKRLWEALLLITAGCLILSVSDIRSFALSSGSLLVLLASICWGLENNCTRMLSLKSPMEIVILKGFGSGLGSLIISLATEKPSFHMPSVLAACLLGFVSYGLSIFFYVMAQRELGAARTGAYYAFAPFIGVFLSFLLFRERLTLSFLAALLLFGLGAYLASSERHKHLHTHAAITHEHRHSHDDGHHDHYHEESVKGEHSHIHTHAPLTHAHSHTPDLHHTHTHTHSH